MREKMRRRQRKRSHQWAGSLSASKCSVNIALSSKQHYSSLSAHYIMARSPTVCRFVLLYYISSLFCYVSSLFLSSPTLYFSIKSLLFSPSFNTFVFYTCLFWIFSPFLEVCSLSLSFPVFSTYFLFSGNSATSSLLFSSFTLPQLRVSNFSLPIRLPPSFTAPSFSLISFPMFLFSHSSPSVLPSCHSFSPRTLQPLSQFLLSSPFLCSVTADSGRSVRQN